MSAYLHPITGKLYGLFSHDNELNEQFFHSFDSFTQKQGGNQIYTTATNAGGKLYLYEKIYNLAELRKEFGIYGNTNAEFILDIILQESVAVCRKFNGKFTIILEQANQTIIIRDQNGEGKMIYYTDSFYTDSYQGLFDFKSFNPEPDLTGITTFLKIGYIPAPKTALKGVNKVPAGVIMYCNHNGIRFEELYGYNYIANSNRPEMALDEAIQKYDDLLKKSLIRRIGESDEVGVLLSGGYDSGGNIAKTREVFPGKIKTYSIGFKDNPASELPYAAMMARQFGAEHHEYIMDGSEIEFLPEIIDALGDPFSESGFMLNHAVMKMVSGEKIPVVIGGDGNDQYFGAGIRETAMHYKMTKLGLKPFSKLFDRISDSSLFDKDNLAFRIHYQNQKILRVMEPETFGFHDFQLKKMFEMGSIPAHGYQDVIPNHFSSYEELFLQRNYYLHLQHSVNEVILFKASRMSNFFDVNLAFSYTDLDIYQFLQHLPVSLRAKGNVMESMKGQGVSKYIHKQLIKPLLPKEVTNRPKQGGFSPLEIFFNSTERRKAIYSYISNSVFARTLKNKNYLAEFFAQYENLATGKSYWFWHKQVKSNQLINLLIVAIWWDRVLDNRKLKSLSDYLT